MPGSPKARTLTPLFDEAALGQLVQLLPQRQGDSVVLEGFPGLARGQPGFSAQPVDESVAAILGFLFQYLQEYGQGVAVSSGGETGHRLGAHGGQLELTAQLADAVLHHAGVRHAHTPAATRLTVSRRS